MYKPVKPYKMLYIRACVCVCVCATIKYTKPIIFQL